MVYFQTKKVLDRVIHQERNVSLHFDISDIVKQFHRRPSELASEGCSGVLE